MNYTNETKEICLAVVAQFAKNDKITAGNINKIRLDYMGPNKGQHSKEVRIALSSICHSAERQLERRAANRKSFTQCADNHLNFDFNNIPGCIGFERIDVEV